MERFGKLAKLVAFKPFASAASALEQINAVSEAQITDDLKAFLETNMPKVRKGSIPACPHVSLQRSGLWAGRWSRAVAVVARTFSERQREFRLCPPASPALAGEGGEEGKVQAGRVRPQAGLSHPGDHRHPMHRQ